MFKLVIPESQNPRQIQPFQSPEPDLVQNYICQAQDDISILTFRVGSFFCSGQNKYDQENGIDLGHFESTNDNKGSNKEDSTSRYVVYYTAQSESECYFWTTLALIGIIVLLSIT